VTFPPGLARLASGRSFSTDQLRISCRSEHGVDYPAGSEGTSWQLIQEGFGILQVRRGETLGEPAIDIGQHSARFFALALALPEPTQARDGSEFEGLHLLALGNVDGPIKCSFGIALIVRREGEEDLSS
jgi:hypothetical protein